VLPRRPKLSDAVSEITRYGTTVNVKVMGLSPGSALPLTSSAFTGQVPVYVPCEQDAGMFKFTPYGMFTIAFSDMSKLLLEVPKVMLIDPVAAQPLVVTVQTGVVVI